MEMGKIFTSGSTQTVPQIALTDREGSPKRVVLVIEGEIVGDNKGDDASQEHGKELMLHSLKSLKTAKIVPAGK